MMAQDGADNNTGIDRGPGDHQRLLWISFLLKYSFLIPDVWGISASIEIVTGISKLNQNPLVHISKHIGRPAEWLVSVRRV